MFLLKSSSRGKNCLLSIFQQTTKQENKNSHQTFSQNLSANNSLLAFTFYGNVFKKYCTWKLLLENVCSSLCSIGKQKAEENICNCGKYVKIILNVRLFVDLQS